VNLLESKNDRDILSLAPNRQKTILIAVLRENQQLTVPAEIDTMFTLKIVFISER